eukprot:COSAG02_NODE_8459_length_2564_cov_2.330495_3_plen_110_part_00
MQNNGGRRSHGRRFGNWSNMAHGLRFLLTRGPYAFLGTGWVGCVPNNGVESAGINQTYDRPAELDVDYGTPVDKVCKETEQGSNVFVREWTRARVQHDCNTGSSTITMK